MKRKRIVILLCTFAVLFGMAACSSKKEEKTVIAVSMIGETHRWPIGVQYYAKEEVKKIAKENGWDYKFVIADNTNEQSDQVLELVKEKVDCIVMLPMDGASLKTAAMNVQDAGIPLVIFDREIPDFAPTATVKGNNTEIGRKTADIFNGMFPDGTKVLELMGDTSTVPQQRTDGFNEVLHSNFMKEQVGYTGWQREDSKELFQKWFSEQTKENKSSVGAIFTHDDEIALGVLDALDEYEKNTGQKMLPNLKVIAGSAGAKEMYQRIAEENEYTLFSLTYSPKMVEKAIQVGEKIIKGEEYEEMTILKTVEVNQKNVKEYYDVNSPY